MITIFGLDNDSILQIIIGVLIFLITTLIVWAFKIPQKLWRKIKGNFSINFVYGNGSPMSHSWFLHDEKNLWGCGSVHLRLTNRAAVELEISRIDLLVYSTLNKKWERVDELPNDSFEQRIQGRGIFVPLSSDRFKNGLTRLKVVGKGITTTSTAGRFFLKDRPIKV